MILVHILGPYKLTIDSSQLLVLMLLYKITLETDNHGRMLEVLHEITPSLKHHLHLRLTCQFFQPLESINKLSYVNYRTNYHGRGHLFDVCLHPSYVY